MKPNVYDVSDRPRAILLDVMYRRLVSRRPQIRTATNAAHARTETLTSAERHVSLHYTCGFPFAPRVGALRVVVRAQNKDSFKRPHSCTLDSEHRGCPRRDTFYMAPMPKKEFRPYLFLPRAVSQNLDLNLSTVF